MNVLITQHSPGDDNAIGPHNSFARTSNESLSATLSFAENPYLKPGHLAELANHDSPEVRIRVSEHSATSLAILEMLAEDEHLDVRYSMAENHATPKHVLRILSRDENPYIVARAEKTLKRIESESNRFELSALGESCSCA